MLLEVEAREEARMATELARFLDKRHDLAATLTEVVRLVAGWRSGSAICSSKTFWHCTSHRPDRPTNSGVTTR